MAMQLQWFAMNLCGVVLLLIFQKYWLFALSENLFLLMDSGLKSGNNRIKIIISMAWQCAILYFDLPQ